MEHEANYLEISRQVLEENAKTVVSCVGVPVIGVVKYDGCGVGIAEAAGAWQKAGVSIFAVSESYEALALRQAGFREKTYTKPAPEIFRGGRRTLYYIIGIRTHTSWRCSPSVR